MEKVTVALGQRSYEIIIGTGILGGLGEGLRGINLGGRIALVTNPTVYALYGEVVMASLKSAGFDPVVVSIPDGEEYKSLLWAEFIWGELLKARLDRSSAVVALGGGVVGDITGFAASAYMRGIRFVQVPTTLLSQVDSSVGGKTGVNHPLGKNMIGAFWQPSLVWIDVDTLETLPGREVLAGMSEVIKYGVIWDEGFFELIKNKREGILKLDPSLMARIIGRSCEIKAEVVSKDEREAGLRAILNYGHTVGHAIEKTSGYGKMLHGEAVAVGMCVEAELASRLGIMNSKEASRVRALVEAYGLPGDIPEGAKSEDMLDAMAVDKKTVGGSLRFTLPEKVGAVRLNQPVDRAVLTDLLSGKT